MLELIKTYLDIIVAILTIIWLLSVYFIFFSKKIKLYRILSKNLSRKIWIVLPSNWDEFEMENEIKMLDNNIYWWLEIYKKYEKFIIKKDLWLIVIWYKKWCVNIDDFNDLITKIVWTNLPIIIYTYWDSRAFNFIEKDKNWILVDKYAKALNRYPNNLVDNFSLKLIWDIFSIMSIYKN